MTGPNVKRALTKREQEQAEFEALRKQAERSIAWALVGGSVIGWFAGVLTVAAWRWLVP